MRWRELAAERGSEASQYYLDLVRVRGWPKDPAERARWIREDADNGVAEAQYLLGGSYYIGDGVPVSTPEAAAWLARSANQGLAVAQISSALCTTWAKACPSIMCWRMPGSISRPPGLPLRCS